MPKWPPSSHRRWSFPRSADRGQLAVLPVLALVHAYRLLLRPIFPPSCRFEPSCSTFALEALTAHGAWRGTLLALRRVARCHPWHPGGYDPVPKLRS